MIGHPGKAIHVIGHETFNAEPVRQHTPVSIEVAENKGEAFGLSEKRLTDFQGEVRIFPVFLSDKMQTFSSYLLKTGNKKRRKTPQQVFLRKNGAKFSTYKSTYMGAYIFSRLTR